MTAQPLSRSEMDSINELLSSSDSAAKIARTESSVQTELLGADAITVSKRRALTARQAAILDWIRKYTRREGAPPTLREIGAAFGIRSTNGVNDHLRALERKGAIRRRDMLSRTIVVLDEVGPEAFIVSLREENLALRELLRRTAQVVRSAPHLSARAALLLGDVDAVLKGVG